MHAVISSSTSTDSVFLFTTFSNEDGIINHRTTERAETHRSICSPVIKVGAPVSLHYDHPLSPPLWLWTLGKLSISIIQFFHPNTIMSNVRSRPFPDPLNLVSSFSPELINSRCANSWWTYLIMEPTTYCNTTKLLNCLDFRYMCLLPTIRKYSRYAFHIFIKATNYLKSEVHFTPNSKQFQTRAKIKGLAIFV